VTRINLPVERNYSCAFNRDKAVRSTPLYDKLANSPDAKPPGLPNFVQRRLIFVGPQ
jgi:hypothetical protein